MIKSRTEAHLSRLEAALGQYLGQQTRHAEDPRDVQMARLVLSEVHALLQIVQRAPDASIEELVGQRLNIPTLVDILDRTAESRAADAPSP